MVGVVPNPIFIASDCPNPLPSTVITIPVNPLFGFKVTIFGRMTNGLVTVTLLCSPVALTLVEP